MDVRLKLFLREMSLGFFYLLAAVLLVLFFPIEFLLNRIGLGMFKKKGEGDDSFYR